ncbi:MAG TPA: NAD(+) kinase [Gammaproteobacteria bacterium]|nr:NAD(+) kinase [Gammaproteobacteria bacterium]
MAAPRFQSVGLIGKYGDPGIGEALARLTEELERRQVRVIWDAASGALPTRGDHQALPRERLGEACDLVIVVGGDGTLLNAARTLADAGVPVAGVNLGRLGFLVDVSPDEMCDRLDEIFRGEYIEEERTLLHASVQRGGETVSESDALNDVVVHKWDIARMIDLETSVDGRFLNTHRADGLIVSTPTGSTAYALSGGGPIVHPTLGALVLVPICPHTLSDRPIVVADRARIEIVVHNGGHSQAQVTFDGQVNFALMSGDRIVVRKKPRALRLIHPPGYDYFHILRAKLRWGENPQR